MAKKVETLYRIKLLDWTRHDDGTASAEACTGRWEVVHEPSEKRPWALRYYPDKSDPSGYYLVARCKFANFACRAANEHHQRRMKESLEPVGEVSWSSKP